MKHSLFRLLFAAAFLALAGSPAFAQGSSSSITGVVVESDGSIVPGANVTVKSQTTGAEAFAVSSATGSFTVPSLNVGIYTVTVKLQGFKTVVIKDVVVNAGVPANVRAKLELGGVTETVEVTAGAEVIQTQAAAVSTTINTKQITSLPVGSRSTLDFAQFLPGVQTSSSVRNSTVDGLPQSSISITLDGVNIQDNTLKTGDGFFAIVSPRLDAIEEVTVTSGAQGAESNGMGAVQIKFTTRSGSNRFTGSGYHFYQSDKFNTNTYANKAKDLPKGPLTLNQPGFRAGGPVMVPSLFDGHNRLFFFTNYEETRQPSTITTNSTLLTADAQAGTFKYTNGPASGVNLFALAAANGHVPTPDPIIAKLLQDIRDSTSNPGSFSDVTGNPNVQRYSFQQATPSIVHYPTVRMDYNLSTYHRFSLSWYHQVFPPSVDTTNSRQRTWPGFPVFGVQGSRRESLSTSLRSTFTKNLVNEVRVAHSGAPVEFSPNLNLGMWTGSLANQGGFALGISAAGITNPGNTANPSARNATTLLIGDTVTWAKGTHSLSFGADYNRIDVWLLNQSSVPTIALGVDTSDPALAMFSSANFPGSISSDRNSAAALYGVLTGRVTSITATARLDPSTGKYVYQGTSKQEARLDEADTFIQDNWRIRPNLSFNVGVRYALQLPFYPLNSSYSTATPEAVWGISGYQSGCDFSKPTPATCNLFKPGVLSGQKTTFVNFAKGTKAYNTDWNNVAPSFGFNWTPSGKHGLLRMVLGQAGETSVSGGWSRSYERHGMSDFTNVYSGNPGVSVSATRSPGNGNLIAPLLFRSGYLGAPDKCPPLPAAKPTGCLLDAPEYPLSNTTATGSVNIFDPNQQVPYDDTYTVGFQRALGKKSAIEVRYVGTRNREQWTTYDYNEANINENGFLNEFTLAQGNLQANIAAGRGPTFAYTGIAGTAPLPIYLAFFSGIAASQAGDTSKYASPNWTSSTFVNPLVKYGANPFTPAGTSTNNAGSGLAADPVRQANSILAGLPANFFRVNPDMLGGANVTGNGGFSKYNSMQMQFRRRLSGGLQFDANYVLGAGYGSTRYSFRVPRILTRSSGNSGDVTHATKATFVYELPFGQAKRWGANTGALVGRLIGGWQLSGTARVQSGRLFDLGNVRVVGMTKDDVQKMFRLRILPKENSNIIIYAWPQDVIDNTILAYSTSPSSLTGYGAGGPPSGRYFAPANGPDCLEKISNSYGDCGVRSLIVTGPVVRTTDLSVRKITKIVGRTTFEFSLDVFNVFSFVTIVPATGIGGTALSSYQAALPTSARTMQIGSRFSW